MIWLGLGQVDGALAALERAWQERDHQMALLQVDPRLHPLRGDPGFRPLPERMRFPLV